MPGDLLRTKTGLFDGDSKMLDIVDLTLLERVVKKSNEEFGVGYGHTMEELAELQIECSKTARGIGDPEKLKEESADVFFRLLKTLHHNGWDLNTLVQNCLDKTRERFPHQLEV